MYSDSLPTNWLTASISRLTARMPASFSPYYHAIFGTFSLYSV
jgi:hypothetical protein